MSQLLRTMPASGQPWFVWEESQNVLKLAARKPCSLLLSPFHLLSFCDFVEKGKLRCMPCPNRSC